MATPDAVIQAVNQSNFDVLHFSCHGEFNYANPEQSCLLLNGRMTVEKIQWELRLRNSPLVVMSACVTGRSKVDWADETNGLNQALLQAGADGIISSLWSVDDESTMCLFKAFYQERLKNGANNTVNLRRAMQTVREVENYKSAFYWGSFQLTGLPTT